jgi:hypothetical protein
MKIRIVGLSFQSLFPLEGDFNKGVFAIWIALEYPRFETPACSHGVDSGFIRLYMIGRTSCRPMTGRCLFIRWLQLPE